jgi:hypothetical protein
MWSHNQKANVSFEALSFQHDYFNPFHIYVYDNRRCSFNTVSVCLLMGRIVSFFLSPFLNSFASSYAHWFDRSVPQTLSISITIDIMIIAPLYVELANNSPRWVQVVLLMRWSQKMDDICFMTCVFSPVHALITSTYLSLFVLLGQVLLWKWMYLYQQFAPLLECGLAPHAWCLTGVSRGYSGRCRCSSAPRVVTW